MRVFVYGTLLTGEGNHRVIAPYVHSICEGRIEGALYNSGPFPYLDVNGNGVVKGEWVTIKKGMEEKALLDLDRLEGYRGEGQMNLYDRVLVPDVNLPEIFGYVYTWPTEKSKKQLLAYPKIASGDWRKRHQETKKIAKKIDQLYFAYGSCMNAKSFLATCPNAHLVGTATLPNYTLTFQGQSMFRTSGVGNIQRQNGAEVIGVLWRITSERDLRALDRREGAPFVYRAVKVSVVTENGEKVQAFTYQMVQPGAHLAPTLHYLGVVLDSPIPSSYKKRIRKIAGVARKEILYV